MNCKGEINSFATLIQPAYLYYLFVKIIGEYDEGATFVVLAEPLLPRFKVIGYCTVKLKRILALKQKDDAMNEPNSQKDTKSGLWQKTKSFLLKRRKCNLRKFTKPVLQVIASTSSWKLAKYIFQKIFKSRLWKFTYYLFVKIIIPCSLLYLLFNPPEISLKPDKKKQFYGELVGFYGMVKDTASINTIKINTITHRKDTDTVSFDVIKNDTVKHQKHTVSIDKIKNDTALGMIQKGSITNKNIVDDSHTQKDNMYKKVGADSVTIYEKIVDRKSILRDSSKTVLVEEMKKAFNEINLRLGDESKWMERKIYYVGILVLGFFLHMMFRNFPSRKSNVLEDEGEDRSIFSVLHGASTLIVISIAFFVALSVDNHLRHNQFMIDINGLWIAEFVEPFYANMGEIPKIIPHYTWEQFLRADGGYRNDSLFNLLGLSCMYVITIGFFACYLALISRNIIPNSFRRILAIVEYKRAAKYTFFFVIAVLFVCALSTHVMPGIYEMKIPIFTYIWKDAKFSSGGCMLWYLFLWLFLSVYCFVLNFLPFYMRLKKLLEHKKIIKIIEARFNRFDEGNRANEVGDARGQSKKDGGVNISYQKEKDDNNVLLTRIAYSKEPEKTPWCYPQEIIEEQYVDLYFPEERVAVIVDVLGLDVTPRWKRIEQTRSAVFIQGGIKEVKFAAAFHKSIMGKDLKTEKIVTGTIVNKPDFDGDSKVKKILDILETDF